MLKISHLLTIFACLVGSLNVTAYVIRGENSTSSSIAKSDAGGPPRYVVYWDQWTDGSFPDVSSFTGFNVVILSFLLSYGAADQASAWANLDAGERAAIKQQYNDAGIILMVSAFGSTDAPTSTGEDPTELAQSMASWVKTYNLDGIDVDYEDYNAVGAGTAASWLSTFTSTLRENLPQGQYIISHAPIAPWFSESGTGLYVDVNNRVGWQIDFYNVQFYNQVGLYETCKSLVFTSGGEFPGSSILEIAASGVDLDKIVMGKIATMENGNGNGYMDPSELALCVTQAKSAGWNGGVMGWQYPSANSDWLNTICS